ncbi:uncharacterized protein G2W53_001904 [Senna tora]|uniref:Uncharacterized protein n=1 Tax=Senna tora TaxID=362788 RepID=A0A834XIM1_9FABA|nr:uncharacterized protein G2W53_001904 [Senna tora]
MYNGGDYLQVLKMLREDQLDLVVGTQRLVKESDVKDLVYLQAEQLFNALIGRLKEIGLKQKQDYGYQWH